MNNKMIVMKKIILCMFVASLFSCGGNSISDAVDYLQLASINILDDARVNRKPVVIKTGWGEVYEPTNESAFYITDISVNQGDSYQQSELSVTVKELKDAAGIAESECK